MAWHGMAWHGTSHPFKGSQSTAVLGSPHNGCLSCANRPQEPDSRSPNKPPSSRERQDPILHASSMSTALPMGKAWQERSSVSDPS